MLSVGQNCVMHRRDQLVRVARRAEGELGEPNGIESRLHGRKIKLRIYFRRFSAAANVADDADDGRPLGVTTAANASANRVLVRKESADGLCVDHCNQLRARAIGGSEQSPSLKTDAERLEITRTHSLIIGIGVRIRQALRAKIAGPSSTQRKIVRERSRLNARQNADASRQILEKRGTPIL